MNIYTSTLSASALAISLLAPDASHSADYSRNVSMTEEVHVSSTTGYAGTILNLGNVKNDDALTGIVSYERFDKPCRAAIVTENINQSSDEQLSNYKDLCSGKAKGVPLDVAYRDVGVNSKRVFVTGIRVCMSKKGKKIKGVQLFGKRLTDDGRLVDIDTQAVADNEMANNIIWYDGATSDDTDKFPVAQRGSCDNSDWEPWAHCPLPRHLAVGAELHFAGGIEPRALTGIALKCRSLSRLTTPAY